MRDRYSVKSFMPIYNENGSVAYTTPDRTNSRRFKNKLDANLFYYWRRLANLFKSMHHTVWRPMYIPLYSIDTAELGVSYQDCGPWRSYHLDTSGDSLNELLENASISEVDQDGGDLDCYSLDDASNEVQEACIKMIHQKIEHRAKVLALNADKRV